MMSFKRYLRSGSALVALVAGVMSAQGVMAQSAPGPEEHASLATCDLVVLVVAARRGDGRVLDAPVAITAASARPLQESSVARVTALATLVPSMVAGRAASGSAASIVLG